MWAGVPREVLEPGNQSGGEGIWIDCFWRCMGSEVGIPVEGEGQTWNIGGMSMPQTWIIGRMPMPLPLRAGAGNGRGLMPRHQSSVWECGSDRECQALLRERRR